MPFSIRNLSVLCYAQGFTLWHYKAGGATLNETEAGGFYNDAASMLVSGDMMMVSAQDGGKIYFIQSEGGTVTTTSLK